MNPFAHFERLAERIFEQDLPRLLGGQLDPLELTRAIDRALDDLAADAPPPAALRLEVAEEAARALAGRTAVIETELSRYAAARIQERWPGERSGPAVRITIAPGLGKREIRAFPERLGPEPSPTAALSRPAPPPSPLRATLHHGDRVLPVERLPAALGRALDNDIVLDDRSVSRYHAQLRAADGKLVIVDLQSTNGTFVNGRRVTGAARLKDGDSVRLGRAALRVRLERRP
ncbi:MAG: FHA domain-containing protein [Chloroflexota bacterium]|nr:FHA domain-containing protein [Dehalococcoidia bacterium]MDW8252401.1 FHA domain-containing protein [Chloroflexota bacterium]